MHASESKLREHTIIYLSDKPDVLFERIMAAGVPALFPKEKTPRAGFDEIWQARTGVYESLATITVGNSVPIAKTVERIVGERSKRQRSTLLLMHGPNLNRLGKRDQELYGTLTLPELEAKTAEEAKRLGYDLITFQSNHEGGLIDWIQAHAEMAAGIIINPGAYTHYSHALHDALVDTHLPAVEVHLSKIEDEPWRQSVIAPACIEQIMGKKEAGYVKRRKAR